MRHAKKQENMIHTQEKKNQSIESVPEEDQTLDLLNKEPNRTLQGPLKKKGPSLSPASCL